MFIYYLITYKMTKTTYNRADLIKYAKENRDTFSSQFELLHEMAINCGLDYYIEQLGGASECDYSYYMATMVCPFGILCFKTEIYDGRETPEDLADYALDIQADYEKINAKFLTIN